MFLQSSTWQNLDREGRGVWESPWSHLAPHKGIFLPHWKELFKVDKTPPPFSHVKQRLHCPRWISASFDKMISLSLLPLRQSSFWSLKFSLLNWWRTNKECPVPWTTVLSMAGSSCHFYARIKLLPRSQIFYSCELNGKLGRRVAAAGKWWTGAIVCLQLLNFLWGSLRKMLLGLILE